MQNVTQRVARATLEHYLDGAVTDDDIGDAEWTTNAVVGHLLKHATKVSRLRRRGLGEVIELTFVVPSDDEPARGTST